MSFIYNYLVSNENNNNDTSENSNSQYFHPQKTNLENHSPYNPDDLLSIYTSSDDEISPTLDLSSVSDSGLANAIDDYTENASSDLPVKVNLSEISNYDLDEHNEWTSEGPFFVSSGLPSLNAKESLDYINHSDSSNNSRAPFLKNNENAVKEQTRKRSHSLSPTRYRSHLTFGPIAQSNICTNLRSRQRYISNSDKLRAHSFPTCRSDLPTVREIPTICERFREICCLLRKEIVETWEFAIEEFSRIFPCFSNCTRNRYGSNKSRQ